MAVFPTPGSPMRTGLFFVRRESTWMMRRISSLRPMTGSSFPLRAASVRSRAYFFSAWNLSSGFWSVTRDEPRTSFNAASNAASVAPAAASAFWAAVPRASASASSRCSVETYSSWNFWAISKASPKAFTR